LKIDKIENISKHQNIEDDVKSESEIINRKYSDNPAMSLNQSDIER